MYKEPSGEETLLAQESTLVGGKLKLEKDKFIRLIALRYIRIDGFSEKDATECAILQWEVGKRGINNISQDVRDRLNEFYKRSIAVHALK